MNLQNRIKQAESVLGINEQPVCSCRTGCSIEHWQQLVDGHASRPIGEPTRTGPPAEKFCRVCGAERLVVAIELVTQRADELEPVWNSVETS